MVGRYQRGALCGLAVALLSLLAGPPAFSQESEILRTVEVEAINTLSRGEHIDEWDLGGLGRAELDFQSRGSRWVRSQLTVRADIADTADGTDLRLTIPRAFVRARFPLGESYLFRTTFGKSRVTWGDGALYNAGDLVFGAEGRRADLLSSTTLRDETDWLVTAFFPLGQFSFIEPVVLVPETAITEGASSSGGEGGESVGSSAAEGQILLDSPSFDQTAVGSRIQWKLANIKMESGYILRGAEEEQELSFSAQGNLLVDLYGGVATTLGPASDGYEELRVSAGALHQLRYGTGSALSFRLEGLIYPDGEWQELQEEEILAEAATEPSDEHRLPKYALYLFPEISWAPSESVALFGRVLVSPIELSALWIGGSEWNIYEGLSLGAYFSVQSGGELDTYGFDRSGGASLTTSVRYLF
ncbi:MAG: hypothetical protein ACLFPW_10090 [Spirochaetaceae bacterium]